MRVSRIRTPRPILGAALLTLGCTQMLGIGADYVEAPRDSGGQPGDASSRADAQAWAADAASGGGGSGGTSSGGTGSGGTGSGGTGSGGAGNGGAGNGGAGGGGGTCRASSCPTCLVSGILGQACCTSHDGCGCRPILGIFSCQ